MTINEVLREDARKRLEHMVGKVLPAIIERTGFNGSNGAICEEALELADMMLSYIDDKVERDYNIV